MSDAETARRLGRQLPEAEDHSSPGFVQLRVRGKQFAWTFLDRSEPTGPREPEISVLAIRCTAADKQTLLASDTEKFFTTDHYRGFPAILVRLANVDDDELRELLTEGWRCQVPKKLAKAFDEQHGA
ncbi:MmcQ/YjbR family DNA-binding protein [Plantactinospora sp. WMMC1484]|uniref:MmcQ/YjbR family DNA-binding protein n=1 Tax=Plantactinospora sp. WMMC1484 TaxID=3404122 RepID=UPI003BF59566